MTEKEAAQRLGRSTRTLYQLRKDGQITYLQERKGARGSKITYREEDIEAYEQHISNLAAWSAAPAKKQVRRNTVKADQREHEQALNDLEREFGLKIQRSK